MNQNEYNHHILEACYSFFSNNKEIDILDYSYLKAPDAFQLLLKNARKCGYYIFTDEMDIINNSQEKLKTYFKDIEDVLEIGPGPDLSVYNKTLPILADFNILKHYYALDISINYLETTQHIIQEKRPDIKITTTEFDLIKDSVSILKPLFQAQTKKACIFLGSTLSNFVKQQQELIIKQISNILKSGEILLLGLDTNQNQTEIIKAYDNKFLKYIILSALDYFCDQFPEIQYCRNYLQPQITYDEKTKQVNLFFKATKNFTITLPKHEIITIIKGQKLKIATLQKYTIEKVKSLVSPYFDIKDTLDYSNKTRIFICQRNNLSFDDSML